MACRPPPKRTMRIPTISTCQAPLPTTAGHPRRALQLCRCRSFWLQRQKANEVQLPQLRVDKNSI
eukprot:4040121-Amphidinium_carterae.1